MDLHQQFIALLKKGVVCFSPVWHVIDIILFQKHNVNMLNITITQNKLTNESRDEANDDGKEQNTF